MAVVGCGMGHALHCVVCFVCSSKWCGIHLPTPAHTRTYAHTSTHARHSATPNTNPHRSSTLTSTRSCSCRRATSSTSRLCCPGSHSTRAAAASFCFASISFSPMTGVPDYCPQSNLAHHPASSTHCTCCVHRPHTYDPGKGVCGSVTSAPQHKKSLQRGSRHGGVPLADRPHPCGQPVRDVCPGDVRPRRPAAQGTGGGVLSGTTGYAGLKYACSVYVYAGVVTCRVLC